MPGHVFRDVEDIPSFTFYDPEQGWPLYTGPYHATLWTSEQQFVDRREDWWAAKIGFAELPEPERIICLPTSSDERSAQLVINNTEDNSYVNGALWHQTANLVLQGLRAKS